MIKYRIRNYDLSVIGNEFMFQERDNVAAIVDNIDETCFKCTLEILLKNIISSKTQFDSISVNERRYYAITVRFTN